MKAKDILKLLKDALKQFGEYSFDDKGPHEVMDVDAIVADLNGQPIADVVKTLEEVLAKGKERGSVLVQFILQSMDDVADDRWDALMASEKLEEAFNI